MRYRRARPLEEATNPNHPHPAETPLTSPIPAPRPPAKNILGGCPRGDRLPVALFYVQPKKLRDWPR
jgi:hypothetical protein